MYEYVERMFNWFANINYVILITIYGGFGAILLGVFITKYLDVTENDETSEKENEKEENEKEIEPKDEQEKELTDTEIEIKYLNEKVVFLEELFSILNTKYIDSLEETTEKIKILEEDRNHIAFNLNNMSKNVKAQNQVLISHGNVISKLNETQTRIQNENKESIVEIKENVDGIQETTKKHRKHIHDLIKYIKEHEDEISLILNYLDKKE